MNQPLTVTVSHTNQETARRTYARKQAASEHCITWNDTAVLPVAGSADCWLENRDKATRVSSRDQPGMWDRC